MIHRAALLTALLLASLLPCAHSAPLSPEGPIRQWVVLGPFPNPQAEAGRSAAARGGFDVDYLGALGGEAKAAIGRTTSVPLPGGAQVGARVVETPDGRLDFNALYTDGVMKLAYACAEITADRDQEALVFLGSDDGAKAWLNGKLVLDVYPVSGRGYTARQDRFTARLRRGTNTLLVKVENTVGGWELGVEVYGAAAARPILAEEERQRRTREFLDQEICPLQTYPGWVFPPGEFPRYGWRDPERIRQLVGDVPLKARWFGPDLQEVKRADKPGRYGVLFEGRLKDGSPVRRALTAYCQPPDSLQWWQQDWGINVPYLGKPFDAQAWREQAAQTNAAAGEMLGESLMTTGRGAVMVAGLAEARPAGRAALFVETPDVRHLDYQVALKRKVLGLESSAHPLAPPKDRSAAPARVLRDGTVDEAGVAPDAKERIDAACQKWAADSGEPFAVLVARHGVIVTHAAFGSLGDGKPCTTDFRNEVASITKAISGMLFARFVDQGLASIDDPIGKTLPGFPTTGPKALTFRHCFTHTSGLEGHGNWAGIWNPYLDNVILNGLPALKPGQRHVYNGMGYDLAGRAMELIAGKSIVRLFTEDLFRPLGFEDVPIGDMAFGARLTARELGTLGQLLANQGSYGDKEYFSPQTFAKMLPTSLKQYWPAIDVEWGIGLTHMAERRPGAPATSTDLKHFSLGPRTIGHGSATSCILRVDPDKDLVVAQIRRTAGPRYDDSARLFFAAIADSIVN